MWWPWPGTPYLYRAVFTFGEDIYEETFGIRTVKVEGTQFLINGKPFYFKGLWKVMRIPHFMEGGWICAWM